MTIPPTYNPDIPTTENNIAESQSNFLNNFKTLFTAFAQNHISLNAASSAGNHNVIELVEQPSSQSTQASEVAIYSKKVAGQTDQLFMRYNSNGKEFQLTEYQIYELPPLIRPETQIPYQFPFFSFLPGGIIVYFGLVLPYSNPFNISLQPTICQNILGVNLCPAGAVNANLPQSNVDLINVNGKFISLLLKADALFVPTQYYLAFGNI